MADQRSLTPEQIEVTRMESAPLPERPAFIMGDPSGDTDLKVYFAGDDAYDDIVL